MSFYYRNMVPLRRWCWSIRGRFRAKIKSQYDSYYISFELKTRLSKIKLYLLGTEHGLRGREGVTCSRRITSRVSFWEFSFDDDPISDWNHSFGLLLLEINVIEIFPSSWLQVPWWWNANLPSSTAISERALGTAIIWNGSKGIRRVHPWNRSCSLWKWNIFSYWTWWFHAASFRVIWQLSQTPKTRKHSHSAHFQYIFGVFLVENLPYLSCFIEKRILSIIFLMKMFFHCLKWLFEWFMKRHKFWRNLVFMNQ